MSLDTLTVFAALAIAIVALLLFVSRKRKDLSRQGSKDGAGGVIRYKVRHVIDGDTVIVSKSWRDFRVRLDAIDCPECGQQWGNMAKAGKKSEAVGLYRMISLGDAPSAQKAAATIALETLK